MDVLVLGASGLLGSNVVVDAQDRGWSVIGAYHSTSPSFDVPLIQLDIQKLDAVRTLLDKYEPEVVINCAAVTDVDGCEERPDEAFAVNGRVPGQLAAICNHRGLAFVQVSTDYVFDGTVQVPYDESAPTNPIQVYGESKLEGECAVRDAHDGAIIVRLSFVWGKHRSTEGLAGFPAWLLDRLVAGRSTALFTDQRVTPARAGSAAKTIVDLLTGGHSGLFHVASRSCVTPYTFGSALCERVNADKTLIKSGQIANIDRPASRPQYTCLDVEKVETTLNRPQPTLEADLGAVSSLL